MLRAEEQNWKICTQNSHSPNQLLSRSNNNNSSNGKGPTIRFEIFDEMHAFCVCNNDSCTWAINSFTPIRKIPISRTFQSNCLALFFFHFTFDYIRSGNQKWIPLIRNFIHWAQERFLPAFVFLYYYPDCV